MKLKGQASFSFVTRSDLLIIDNLFVSILIQDIFKLIPNVVIISTLICGIKKLVSTKGIGNNILMQILFVL